MPQRITVIGVGPVDFPDGWTDAQIESKAAELTQQWQAEQKVRNTHLAAVSAQPTAEEAMPAWKRNIAAFLSDTPTSSSLPDLGAAPNRIAAGIHMLGSTPTPDNPSPNARGMNKIVSGASTVALPLLAPAAFLAPAATAGALALGAGEQWAGQKAATSFGADPDEAELAGNVASAVAAPIGSVIGAKAGPAVAGLARRAAASKAAPAIVKWGSAAAGYHIGGVPGGIIGRGVGDSLAELLPKPTETGIPPVEPTNGTAEGLESPGDALARLTATNPGAGRPSGVSTSRIPFMADPRGEVPAPAPQRLADIGRAPTDNQGGTLARPTPETLGAPPDDAAPSVSLPPSVPSMTPSARYTDELGRTVISSGNPGAAATTPSLREQLLMREAPASPVDDTGRDLGGYGATEPPSVRRSGPPAGTTERRLTPREDINAYVASDPRAIAKADEARQRFANQRTPEPADTPVSARDQPGAELAVLLGTGPIPPDMPVSQTAATGRRSRARVPGESAETTAVRTMLRRSGQSAQEAIAAVESNPDLATDDKTQLLGILRSLGGSQ